MKRPGIVKFGIFAVAMIVSWMVGSNIAPTWTVEQISLWTFRLTPTVRCSMCRAGIKAISTRCRQTSPNSILHP